jgi:hypothetical protein
LKRGLGVFASGDSMTTYYLDRILKGVLLLYVTGLVIYVWVNPGHFQWDFDVYYAGAKACSVGANPYDSEVLAQYLRVPTKLDFVYPSITLLVFRPFLLMQYSLAYHLFLALKCLLLIGLLFLWKTFFLRNKFDFLFVLFCFFGFNGAVFLDFMAGNISIFEQFLLWVGFYFFLKRRFIYFGSLIVVAAAFKIVPILFLFLLWHCDDGRKYYYFGGFVFLFALFMGSSYIAAPELFAGFVHNALRFSERGIINPSNYSLIADFFKLLYLKTGVNAPGWIPATLFMGVAVVVLAVSYRAYKALKAVQILDRDLIVLFMACIVYALILPRFKDYSYILLLPPAYFIITRVQNLKTFPILFAILILT